MAAPTVNVTCTASDQNGNPVAFGRYTAKLDRTVVYQGFVVPEQVEVVANAQGVAVLALFPNTLGVDASRYLIKAINPDTGKKFLDTTIQVPNAPCNLFEILVQEPFPAVGVDPSIAIYNAFQEAFINQATSLVNTQAMFVKRLAFA